MRPIIGQQTVPVLDDDTPESSIQRIHGAEHELYPRCVAAIARREISVAWTAGDLEEVIRELREFARIDF